MTRTYYTHTILSPPRKISIEEEREIFARYVVSQDKTEIVNAYLHWALDMARKSMGSTPDSVRQRPGCSEDDAISAANLGLVEAIDRFDVAKGRRFSYFASFWISKRLRLLRLQQHTVRVPEGVVDDFCAMKRLERDGVQDDEIAVALGLTSAGLAVLRELPTRGNTCAFDPDFHDSPHEESHASEKTEMLLRLKTAREKLSPLNRRLIRWRFDLSLSEVEMAKREGVSVDTIQRRLKKAMLKLRCYLDC